MIINDREYFITEDALKYLQDMWNVHKCEFKSEEYTFNELDEKTVLEFIEKSIRRHSSSKKIVVNKDFIIKRYVDLRIGPVISLPSKEVSPKITCTSVKIRGKHFLQKKR